MIFIIDLKFAQKIVYFIGNHYFPILWGNLSSPYYSTLKSAGAHEANLEIITGQKN